MALLVTLAVLGASAHEAAAAALPRGVILRSVVDPDARSRLPSYHVSRSFLGLSAEYDKVLNFTGTSYFGYDQPFINLMRGLGAYGGGFPSLRVGGYTEDYAWWNPNHRSGTSRRLYYSITNDTVSSLQTFEAQAHMPLVLGLNFGNPDNRYALGWAREATSAFGKRVLFEFGNEPDLYGDRFPYRSGGRVKYTVPLRRHWTFSAYLHEWRRRAEALERAVHGLRLAGPSTETYYWTRAIPQFLDYEHPLVKAASAHVYPLCTCVHNRRFMQYPTLGHLLSFANIFDSLRLLTPVITQARHHHLPFRITEIGPIAGGGGKLGSSFAAALWGLNAMFSLAEVGASGLNFHTGGTYTPIVPGYRGQLHNGGYWVAYAQPMYYAMLLFARATGDGARFLPDPSFLTSAEAPGGNMAIWASVNRAHIVHVVLVNGMPHRAGNVQIRLPHALGRASLVRLTAPSPLASHGLRLAGQSFAYPTADGTLQGAYVSHHVRRDRSGYFAVSMPAASAAMLTVATH